MLLTSVFQIKALFYVCYSFKTGLSHFICIKVISFLRLKWKTELKYSCRANQNDFPGSIQAKRDIEFRFLTERTSIPKWLKGTHNLPGFNFNQLLLWLQSSQFYSCKIFWKTLAKHAWEHQQHYGSFCNPCKPFAQEMWRLAQGGWVSHL